MSATGAKRPATSRKSQATGAKPKRPTSAARRQIAREPERPAAAEPFDGPGYHFAGFRMMCRHRHARH